MFLTPRRIVLCMSFLTAIAASTTAQAQSQALIDKVKVVIAADTPRLEATFKDLHANPELAFTETRTARHRRSGAEETRLTRSRPASARPASSAC